MSDDFDKVWRRSLVLTGALVMERRTAGQDWRAIASELGSDVDTIRRAAAMYLSADLATRQPKAVQ